MLLLGRAIDYRTVLDDFVAKNRELRKYELQDEDWEAIALVAQWLKSFCSATTQMSTTKRPMLSHLEKPPSQIWVYMSKFGKIC
jgi:hypothetical protein